MGGQEEQCAISPITVTTAKLLNINGNKEICQLRQEKGYLIEISCLRVVMPRGKSHVGGLNGHAHRDGAEEGRPGPGGEELRELLPPHRKPTEVS